MAHLEEKFGLQSMNYEHWTYMWTGNPVCRQLQFTWPIGWVLESQGRVVGALANVPLECELEGRRILTATGRAWVVETEYRGYALALQEQFFTQKRVELFLNTTVNAAATNAFRVFQSSPAPVGAWNQGCFWITNYRGFMSSYLAMKSVPISRPLSHMVSVAPYVKDLARNLRSRRLARKSAVRVCSTIDERFDRLWEALRVKKSHVLMGVRDRETLDWHFKFALQGGRAWILTVGSDRDLVAYAIFVRLDNPKYGLRRVRLVDFQSLDPDPDILLEILARAAEKCRYDGIHMLESAGFADVTRSIITAAAPYKHQFPSWLYFYKAANTELGLKLSEPSVWDPSLFDGDASL